MAERPWRVLRDQHPEIELMLCDLPAGVDAIYAQRGEDTAILVSRSLDPAERLAAICHELHHHRRGGGLHDPDAPPLLQEVCAKEERRVEALVADDLVPPADLAAYVRSRSSVGSVTARDVADDFEVPVEVADRALRRLLNERRSA